MGLKISNVRFLADGFLMNGLEKTRADTIVVDYSPTVDPPSAPMFLTSAEIFAAELRYTWEVVRPIALNIASHARYLLADDLVVNGIT